MPEQIPVEHARDWLASLWWRFTSHGRFTPTIKEGQILVNTDDVLKFMQEYRGTE